jgi:hypothetical protein
MPIIRPTQNRDNDVSAPDIYKIDLKSIFPDS